MPKWWTSGFTIVAVVVVVFTCCVVKIARYNASAARGMAEFDRAYALMRQGKFKEGLVHCDAALAEVLDDEHRAAALCNRGFACSVLGRQNEAVAALTAALRLQPRNVASVLDRGIAYHRQGNFAEALADYTRCIALSPNVVDAYQNRALIYAHRGQLPEAIADLKEAIRCAPNDARWTLRLGMLLLANGEAEAARDRFDEAIRLAPQYAEAYWWRARAWTRLKHPERGLADIEAALAQSPDSAPLHLARAMILLDAFRPDLAMHDLDVAAQLAPDFAMAFATRAVVHFLLHENDAAINDANTAMHLAPTLAQPYCVIGWVRDAQRRETEAIASFDKAIAREREFPPPLGWRALAEAHAGEYEKARKDLEAATKEFPGSSEVHRARALFLASCPDAAFRNGPTALTEAQLSAELADGDPNALDVLAIAYAEVGNFNRAIATEAAALEKTPPLAGGRGKMQARLHNFELHQPFRDYR